MRSFRWWLVIPAFLLLVELASAADNPDLIVKMALRVRGFDESALLTNITLDVGEGITKAIRIYSEPSHTILAVVVNTAEMPKAEQTPWWKDSVGNQRLPPRTAVAKMPGLVGKTINLQTRSYPLSDTHLMIYTLGVWPDGEERDGLFGDFYVPRTFDFTLKRGIDRRTDEDFVQHCCGGSGCDGDCTDCQVMGCHVMLLQDGGALRRLPEAICSLWLLSFLQLGDLVSLRLGRRRLTLQEAA